MRFLCLNLPTPWWSGNLGGYAIFLGVMRSVYAGLSGDKTCTEAEAGLTSPSLLIPRGAANWGPKCFEMVTILLGRVLTGPARLGKVSCLFSLASCSGVRGNGKALDSGP
jgi:hypothetical protein